MRPCFTHPRGHFSAVVEPQEYTMLGHEFYSPEGTGHLHPNTNLNVLFSHHSGKILQLKRCHGWFTSTNYDILFQYEYLSKPLLLRISKLGGLEIFTTRTSVVFNLEFRNPFPEDIKDYHSPHHTHHSLWFTNREVALSTLDWDKSSFLKNSCWVKERTLSTP